MRLPGERGRRILQIDREMGEAANSEEVEKLIVERNQLGIAIRRDWALNLLIYEASLKESKE